MFDIDRAKTVPPAISAAHLLVGLVREHNSFVREFRTLAAQTPEGDSGLRNPAKPDTVIRYKDVTPDELEKLLGLSVYAMLPDDYGSIYEAYTEGQLVPANTNLGRQMARLASKVAGIQEQTGKKKFSLFGG